MTQYTRTISRQITNSMPAWRQAMTAEDTVYEIGGLPSALSSSIEWPAAGAANFLMNGGGDSNSYLLHAAYGGSVFAPDVGTYGTMIFGRTGEATIDNQLSAFTLSDDAPAWTWFQQPDYAISEAEAITAGADWYYNAADYAALPSGKKIDAVGESAFSASWDGTFPVGYKNWIARRKHQGSVTGNSRPWFFRYNMPRYVPAAMTGDGDGAIVVNSRGTIYGPFSQGSIPAGGTDAAWFADVWGTGRRQQFLWAMNVRTKVWQRLPTPLPDFTGYGGDITAPHACVDEQNKRVYYSTYNGSNHAPYYAGFSGGFAGMTVSGPTSVSDLAGGPAPSQSGNSVLAVPQSGANAGRRLWYMKDSGSTASMLLWDLDATPTPTLRRLTIAGLPTTAEWWGFGYRAATNELLITTKSATGVRSYRAPIPTDPTSAAGYVFTSSLLTLASGVVVEASGLSTGWQYGERSQYIDSLGVVLISQRNNKMLAYRPGA